MKLIYDFFHDPDIYNIIISQLPRGHCFWCHSTKYTTNENYNQEFKVHQKLRGIESFFFFLKIK